MKKIIMSMFVAALFACTSTQAKADAPQEFSVNNLLNTAVSPEDLREYALNGFTLDMIRTVGYVDIIYMDADVLKMFIENRFWLTGVTDEEEAQSILLLDGVDQMAIFERPDADEIFLCLAENCGNFCTATKLIMSGLPFEYDDVWQIGSGGFSSLPSDKRLPWADEVISVYEITVLNPKKAYLVTRDYATGQIIKKQEYLGEESLSPKQKELLRKIYDTEDSVADE
ncbi:MAG: hypothetical protein II085_04080 [Alphaproteobacteria bacterium]|nr:hypothetical protein [Alphaproteobacteria bacterium]